MTKRNYTIVIRFRADHKLSEDELYELSRWAPDCLDQVWGTALESVDVYNNEEDDK